MKPVARMPGEAAIAGIVFVIAGVLSLHGARAAEQRHAYIPFKSGSMTPLQAYLGGGLCLAVGLYLLITWFVHRRSK